MYNSSGSFVVVSLEDLSNYETFYRICEGVLTENQALILATNCAKAVAELHSIDVVHGDLASENILVDPVTMDVKIIDFDLASKVRSSVNPAGNLDFVSLEMAEAIKGSKSKVESQFQTDLYALAMCCYLVLGDRNKLFFQSLSGDGLPIQAKENMIFKEQHIACDIVKKLLAGTITASGAAEGFNEVWQQLEAK